MTATRKGEAAPVQFSSLKPDLQHWLRQSIVQGCTPRSLEQAMLNQGYAADFAQSAVTAAFAELAPATAAQDAAVPAAETTTQILAAEPNELDAGDRPVHILFALNSPRVLLFGSLLAPEECEALITMSRGKLQRSNVVDRQTGHYEHHPDRTSEGTHFARGENALIQKIEARIAGLTGCPVEHGEPIQILHYGRGHEYKPHFDYFDPADPGNRNMLSAGGQRVATLIMYLNDVEAGGSTVFPQIGLDVLPRRGNAVYFAYCDAEGRLDARSLHGGSPVAAGEKWIATKWLRQGPYTDCAR